MSGSGPAGELTHADVVARLAAIVDAHAVADAGHLESARSAVTNVSEAGNDGNDGNGER